MWISPAYAQAAGGAVGFDIVSLAPLVLIFVVFYFLMIRPAQKRERLAREAIAAGLKKNVEVVTHAGIFGTVTNIKDEEVTIKIDDNCKMRILRSAIARIITPTTEGDKPAEKTS